MAVENRDRLWWLERALRNLKSLKQAHRMNNEENTKRLVVEPLLAWMGYDVWDINDLQEQYPIPKKEKGNPPLVDYALKKPGLKTPHVLIEAKPVGADLGSYLEQIIDYCNYSGVGLGMLTNGERWVLLNEQWKGMRARDRKVFELNIEEELGSRKGYHALLLLHPENEGILHELIPEIKKLREAGVSKMARHIKAEIVDAVEKLRAPDAPGAEEELYPPQAGGGEREGEFWIMSVANSDDESAVARIRNLVAGKGVFATKKKCKIRPGDRVLFYAEGKGVVAKARVKNLLKRHALFGEDYGTIFEVDETEMAFDAPVDLRDETLRKQLDAFRNKEIGKRWGGFVSWPHKITKHDFELLRPRKP